MESPSPSAHTSCVATTAAIARPPPTFEPPESPEPPPPQRRQKYMAGAKRPTAPGRDEAAAEVVGMRQRRPQPHSTCGAHRVEKEEEE